MTQPETRVVPLEWVGSADTGHLRMLDQRRLPAEIVWDEMTTVDEVAAGIRQMNIRGAPAIGIAAAYGVFLGFRGHRGEPNDADIEAMFALLERTRPTAVNLFWALERMRRRITELSGAAPDRRVEGLLDEAHAIFQEDRGHNVAMGRHGAALFSAGVRVLTHCNTGGLATGGYGTALGVIRTLHAAGKLERVWIDETRPYLQGARLTAWECVQDGLPGTLITDSMAAALMQQGMVDAVIVGADRVAANGDVANKIGTYGLAVLCCHHGIPFYVAAPTSTIDPHTPTGATIPIEQRSAAEVTHIGGVCIAPAGIDVAHPAFDVTPAELITALITECGVTKPPTVPSLNALLRCK